MIIQQNLYFSDAGAFCDAVQGFDVEFRQLDRGPLSANLSFLVTAECSIQDVSFTRRFHQQGIGPTDMLSFGLPDESTLRNWRGAPISESRLLNFSRPGGYDSVSEKGFSAYTFAVSERLLQAELDAQGSAIRAADLQASGDWRLPDANLASLLRSIGYQAISNETAIAEQPARVAKLQSSLVHVIAQPSAVTKKSLKKRPARFYPTNNVTPCAAPQYRSPKRYHMLARERWSLSWHPKASFTFWK